MTVQAWPFLVARGHRLGYRTLLAPGWLVAEHGQGTLSDAVRPAGDRPEIVRARTRSGRDLTLVHATHRISPDDLCEAEPPLDEHGRPLRLMYGFVCPAVQITPDDLDMQAALAAALETYRRFRSDEERFSVASSDPFPIHTTTGLRTGASTISPPRPLLVYLLAASVLAVLVAVLLTFIFIYLSPEAPPPTPTCPAASAMPAAGPSTPPTCIDVGGVVRAPNRSTGALH